MPPDSVVIALDVSESLLPGLRHVLEGTALEQFDLVAREEAFAAGVVVSLARAALALFTALPPQQLAELCSDVAARSECTIRPLAGRSRRLAVVVRILSRMTAVARRNQKPLRLVLGSWSAATNSDGAFDRKEFDVALSEVSGKLVSSSFSPDLPRHFRSRQ